MPAEPDAERIRLAPGGVEVGGEVVPLLAAAAHYWRLDPKDWRPALTACRDLGFRLVDTYVPWGPHETGPGEFDFGRRRPELDVARFVEIAGELGLYAIVRPGPHINAELTYFGIPERVIWDPKCQARSPKGHPVVLPVPPLAFPVPSMASHAFHTEVAQWFGAVGAELAHLVWPKGPIVLLQVDNESALYFRDGVYDQDYHPDAITQYRRFLQKKYVQVERLREAYSSPKATFARIEPPRHVDAPETRHAPPHLDWAEFQEQMLADALARMRDELVESGFDGVPTTQNFPIAELATPLDAARVSEAVDLIGLDYYAPASEQTRADVAHRTTELALRCEARSQPPFGCEVGAGFPPFLPPLSPRDNEFCLLSALAYGLRGFNAYMAVERDRWIGAPIDSRGKRRETADFWERLNAVFEQTRFHELRRELPVRILVPRSLRRLERVLHAFGPASAAALRVLGFDGREGCLEDELGDAGPNVTETASFLERLERGLEARGIPFGVCGTDLAAEALEQARWVVVVCPGKLERDIVRVLENRPAAAVTLGPFAPRWSDGLAPLEARLDVEPSTSVPGQIGRDAIDETLERAVASLDLPVLRASPPDVLLTLHVDAGRRPRVLFVINSSSEERAVAIPARGFRAAEDPFRDRRYEVRSGTLEITVSPLTVTLLSLS